MHEVLWDEITVAANQVREINRSAKVTRVTEYFAVNDCAFGEYVYRVFCKAGVASRHVYVSSRKSEKAGVALGDYREIIYDNEMDTIADFSNCALFFFVDCRNEAYNQPEERHRIINNFQKWLKYVESSMNCRLFLIPLIKPPERLPRGVRAVAEREYDCYLSRKALDAGEELYCELEGLCRKHGTDKTSILRFDNIFGPGVDLISSFSLREIINKSFEDEKVEITSEDRKEVYSYMYIRDAVSAVAVGAQRAKPGHIYNISNYAVSKMEILINIHDVFPERLALTANVGKCEEMVFHALDPLKFRSLGWSPRVEFAEAIYRTIIYYRQIAYDLSRNLQVYSGRLERIRRAELEMLGFVDRVCKENKINYFLAGGSLLGAVRHRGMIPWDDDLDIGMLRENFEKFRRLCPKVIPEQYTYESPGDETGSHYCIDKIRLKNTYFSTEYSGEFLIQDGVFLDIIVYDRTANSKVLSYLHIFMTLVWTKLISIKWVNHPRREVHYFFSKIALPILRLLPFRFCHAAFEKSLRHYEKKKNAKYLIDGVGQNIRKGRFPRQWLEQTITIPFEDAEVPIPVGYDGYLRHFYGPNYMDLLPVSERVSGHKLMRIDLGGYLYGDGAFRRVNLKGELFERN